MPNEHGKPYLYVNQKEGNLRQKLDLHLALYPKVANKNKKTR